MKIIKKNYKLLIGIIIGSVIAGTGVYAATVISSKDVSYDNTKSLLLATNVKDALDELSTKTELKNRDNIVEGYTYNQTSGASNYCITGEEATCVKTTCYRSTTANSCKAGDIIKYKVNDTDIVTFHVMFDNGTTMTMQSQKNIVTKTAVVTREMYLLENTDSTSCLYDACNDEGPLFALRILKYMTQGWINVNDQTYTMGTTVFKTNAYTGCTAYNSCNTNTYTLDSQTVKARIITMQEAVSLGCTSSYSSCPKWMYNYLAQSTSYGGTINSTMLDAVNGSNNNAYLTMSADSQKQNNMWVIAFYGNAVSSGGIHVDPSGTGIRPIVVISK